MALGISAIKILKEKTSGFGRRRQDYFDTDESNQAISFEDVTDIIAFGDSYTNPGLQATPVGSPSANAYISLLVATIGKGVTNRANTGTGILTAQYESITNDVQPRVAGITCMTGLNDTNRNGGGATFIDYWGEWYKSFLTSNLVASGKAASDLTATSWFNYANSGYNKAHQFGVGKQTKGTQTLYSGTQELSYTFNDDHVIMQYLVSRPALNPATYLDTMQIRIDGVLVDTINCQLAESQDIPGWEVFSGYLIRCKIYSGLSNGSHTITVRRTANSGGAGAGVFIDYFGHLGTDTSDTKPLLLGDVTYITNYAQTAPYNNGSQAAADAANTKIQELVDEILAIRPNLPIAIQHTNTDAPALDSGDYNADGLHWNNSGHNKGYQKFLAKISAY